MAVESVGIVNRVTRLAAYFARDVEAVFSRLGITSTEFAIIANLRRVGAPYQLTQRDLMEALQLTSGTVSVRIDRLAEKGLVSRKPDPRDGRNVLVTLTSAGADTFDDAAPEHLANEEHLLAALRPKERQELARLLRILLIEFEQPARDRPDDRIGVRIAPAHAAQQRRAAVGLTPAPGLLVESVRAQSPAHAAKITPGDLLIEANGVPLQSLTCLARALPATSGTVSIVVQHGKSVRTEAIAVGASQTDARLTT